MSSRKNPWGDKKNNNDNQSRSRNGSGGNGGYGGGEPPDLDDVLRQAQDNLKNLFPGGFNGFGLVFLSALVIACLWAFSGFYIVNPGEHAVIQRFGERYKTKEVEGLGYRIPYPVDKLTKVSVDQVREMTIGYQTVETRSGRATTIDQPEESLMLTSDANIVDLDLEVQWDIKSAEDFLFNIKDPEETIKKVAESAIREVIGQTDMFPIITRQRQQVANRAKEIMIRNLDEYQSGINIKRVLIQDAQVHPDVQAAFQDVQSANQDAENSQNLAEAYREDILPRAEGLAIQMEQQAQGYKESVIARAEGDAERFNSVYQAYLKGEDVTKRRIYIETMESVLKNAQKIIMDESSSQGVVPYLPLDQMRPAAGNTAPPAPQINTQNTRQRR